MTVLSQLHEQKGKLNFSFCPLVSLQNQWLSLGQQSGTTLTVLTRKHKQRVFPKDNHEFLLLLAAKEVLLLLQYSWTWMEFESLRVKKFRCLMNFGLCQQFFLSCKNVILLISHEHTTK